MVQRQTTLAAGIQGFLRQSHCQTLSSGYFLRAITAKKYQENIKGAL
jgi:hypothetical protein|tara:strand:+ start:74 stop:214 length:141 start_codon:yes stop_codon:yes gene_type:complete